MASAKERSARKTRRSAAPPSLPESPSTEVAPSTLAIMLRRTGGRSFARGRSAYTSMGSTGSAATGSSWRTVLRASHPQHVPAAPKERQGCRSLIGRIDELVHVKDSAVEAVGVPDVTGAHGVEVRR